VCTYVCIQFDIYACIPINARCMLIFLHKCECMLHTLYVYIHTYMITHMHAKEHIFNLGKGILPIYIYIYIYIYTYIHTFTCIYIHIYYLSIYMRIHTHTHIYTYIQACGMHTCTNTLESTQHACIYSIHTKMRMSSIVDLTTLQSQSRLFLTLQSLLFSRLLPHINML
jgi:hypothetical protein